MEPTEREEAQRRGKRKLDAMKRRATRLRERVVVTAIVGFVLLWAVVFVQMATGNDPALGTGPVAKKHTAIERDRRKIEASSPPPREETEQAPTTTELEARELEELEELAAVSTGQS